MKQIEINKELDLKDVVEVISLNTRNAFQYEKEINGIRCKGPFYVEGRYSTQNEVNHFQDVFTFDIFASNEKLDGSEFKLVYTGYDYSINDTCLLTLHFDVHGIYAEEINTSNSIVEEGIEEPIEEKEENAFAIVEELFDEKDSVVSSYSLIVVKRNDNYESIAERYRVDVNLLREVNQNKEISEKDVIVLPYK